VGSETSKYPIPATRLEIPSGKEGTYRIAQQDDYTHLPRRKFLHNPPLTMTLQARVSENNLPGTWGFGFWNDPFSLGLGIKGSGVRLPALPEAVWFFYGSTRNDLSFQAHSPANGFTASVFSSMRIPSILLPFGLPGLFLLPIKPAARMVRKIASRLIKDSFKSLAIDPTDWHTYQLDWLPEKVDFHVDGKGVFSCSYSPRPPLGLVIWVDNQFAAFSANGEVRYGTEANPTPAWLEIRELVIQSLPKPEIS
jgi:hypothetical protein